MPASTEVKIARPPSHPNRLLLRASRPQPDSTREMLGRRRQSRLWRSAAFRNSSEKSRAGQLPFRKNPFRTSHRGSVRCLSGAGIGDAAGEGNPAFVTATGADNIPAIIKPLERTFFIGDTSPPY